MLRSSKRISGWCDKHVKSIVYQMLCGLLYMQVLPSPSPNPQSANLIHRDLKPSNILLDGNCNVKIVDFGLARQINSPTRTLQRRNSMVWEAHEKTLERQLTQHVVTRWYRAPELITLQNHYNASIDMWSVGCIMVSFPRGTHAGGVAADAGDGHGEDPPAVSGHHVLSAERSAEREEPAGEDGAGVSRGDASAGEDL